VGTLGMSAADREAVERFRRDVIEPSRNALVIIDFWAEWCGPCKQLTPVIEKVAADYADKGVKLVKINVDEEKLIAAQFRIQSIPTVYAVFEGQPVADLTQARTEGQLKRLLDQLLAQLPIQAGDAASQEAEIAPLIQMGEEVLADGDAERARIIFAQLQEMAPGRPDVVSGLARAMIAVGDVPGARALLDTIPEEAARDVARARSALDLAESAPSGEAAQFEQRIAADPDDLQARFDLAGAQLASGDRDGAADQLLEIIRRDREWKEGAARKKLLQAIEAVGLEDPWAGQQRRRLSAILFT
jgi:putative thioredoxin